VHLISLHAFVAPLIAKSKYGILPIFEIMAILSPALYFGAADAPLDSGITIKDARARTATEFLTLFFM
jgi:hypothetical protein